MTVVTKMNMIPTKAKRKRSYQIRQPPIATSLGSVASESEGEIEYVDNTYGSTSYIYISVAHYRRMKQGP